MTSSRRIRSSLSVVCSAGLALLMGCGSSTSDPANSGGPADPAAALPAAAISAPNPESAAGESDDYAAKIAEITRLRTLPESVVEVRYEGGERQPESERPLTPEEIAAEQVRRNELIIELAGAVIRETHESTEHRQLFNNAVHYLAEARMELALSGHADQAQMLADDAEALHKRDPSSFAAVETGYRLVQLAKEMAQRYGAEDPKWVIAYAHQARLFAERFRYEQGRSAVSLITAGRKCEQFGLHEEARKCFFVVEQYYPDSPFTEQIEGILRRLRLVGQPLELAGSTIDGGFLSFDQFAGKPALIVFWASGSQTFRNDLAKLKELRDTFGDDQLTIIGVNLDQNEFAVDAFLEETGLPWRQIFFSDADQRGGRNPVARYYGVHAVPTYWVVDAKGVVVAAPASINELSASFASLIGETEVQVSEAPGEAVE